MHLTNWLGKGRSRSFFAVAAAVALLASQLAPWPLDGGQAPPSVEPPAEIVQTTPAPEAPVSVPEVPVDTRAVMEDLSSRSTAPRGPVARRLPTGSPESVGMDPRALDKVDAALQRYVNEGLFPGAVVLVARKGVVVKHTSLGNAAVYAAEGQPLPAPVPMTTDTMFDIASLTKVFTATAALVLVDQGRLDLDAAVAAYLPECANGGKEQITVRQLLSHTAGLPAGLQLWKRGTTPEERLSSAFAMTIKATPGSKYEYSDGGPILVGQIVERVTGQKLDRFLNEAVLQPLGAVNTTYRPAPELRERIAATEVLPKTQPGVRWGVAHDGEARALDGVAGNAGLFATAADVALLGQMMLDGGAIPGGTVLRPETAGAAVQPQPGTGGDRGLGWEIGQKWYMGSQSSPSAYGHTGFTGTSLVVDPAADTVVVLLTNSLHPHAEGSTNPARRDLANAVSAAIIR